MLITAARDCPIFSASSSILASRAGGHGKADLRYHSKQPKATFAALILRLIHRRSRARKMFLLFLLVSKGEFPFKISILTDIKEMF